MHHDDTPLPTRSASAFGLAWRFLLNDPSGIAPMVPETSCMRHHGYSPSHDGEEPTHEAAWVRAGRWLAVWGLGMGAAYAVVFSLTWRFLGEYQGVRWLPIVAVLILDLAWLGRRLMSGAVGVCVYSTTLCEPGMPRSPDTTTPLVVVLIALAKFALLASLPVGTWQTPPTTAWEWPQFLSRLSFLCPPPIYRPLILMPFWGRWAMTLAASIGRPAPEASDRLHRIASARLLPAVLGQWLAGAVLTVIYCTGASEHMARGMVIVLGILLATYWASFILARRCNGQTEATVACAGLVAELVFLVLYVAAANVIYWY